MPLKDAPSMNSTWLHRIWQSYANDSTFSHGMHHENWLFNAWSCIAGHESKRPVLSTRMCLDYIGLKIAQSWQICIPWKTVIILYYNAIPYTNVFSLSMYSNLIPTLLCISREGWIHSLKLQKTWQICILWRTVISMQFRRPMYECIRIGSLHLQARLNT
jgi:hypothetical protein